MGNTWKGEISRTILNIFRPYNGIDVLKLSLLKELYEKTFVMPYVVLLMGKFESTTVVKRKWQSDFGKTTPTEHQIRTIVERFCASEIVEDWSQSGRLTGINQEKVDEVNHFLQTHPWSSVRGLLQKPLRYHK